MISDQLMNETKSRENYFINFVVRDTCKNQISNYYNFHHRAAPWVFRVKDHYQ